MPDLKMYITTSRVRGSRRRGRNASNRYFAREMAALDEQKRTEAVRERERLAEFDRLATLVAKKPKTKRAPRKPVVR